MPEQPIQKKGSQRRNRNATVKATVYDEATGEAVPVCPAKGTKPSIAVTFKTT